MMRFLRFCFSAVVACVVAPTALFAQAALPEIRQFDIATLEQLGHEIFDQDQASWHATDALLALHPPAQLQSEKINGWIVETGPDGTLVRFIRDGANGPEAAYDIHCKSSADLARDKPDVSEPQDRHLTDTEKAQNSARLLALKSVTQRCGDNYNTVVLKDPQGDGWLAWALAATRNPNLLMMGGHHRLTISADGSKVLRMDALSVTCAAMQKGGGPKDAKTVAFATTQLVSNIPVETFVFLNLQEHLTFYVITPDRMQWKIDDGKISAVGAPPEKPAAN